MIDSPKAKALLLRMNKIPLEIASITEHLIDNEPLTFELQKDKPWAQGASQQRDRIEAIAEYCVQRWDGDLIEIGPYYGATTVRLLKIARRYRRRVIAVDPWEPGTQNCTGRELPEFLRKTNPFFDILDIIRMSSLEEEAIALIGEYDLCFAFIDGLHTHKACFSDILAVSHCRGIIAVDDILWDGNLIRAFREGAERLQRQIFKHKFCREGYLLPC